DEGLGKSPPSLPRGPNPEPSGPRSGAVERSSKPPRFRVVLPSFFLERGKHLFATKVSRYSVLRPGARGRRGGSSRLRGLSFRGRRRPTRLLDAHLQGPCENRKERAMAKNYPHEPLTCPDTAVDTSTHPLVTAVLGDSDPPPDRVVLVG